MQRNCLLELQGFTFVKCVHFFDSSRTQQFEMFIVGDKVCARYYKPYTQLEEDQIILTQSLNDLLLNDIPEDAKHGKVKSALGSVWNLYEKSYEKRD